MFSGKLTITLCLDSKFGWKRMGRKGKGGKGKEGKRNGRKVVLVCLGGNGRERKEDCVFFLNLSTFGEIITLNKFIPIFLPIPSPSNPFPPILLSKQGILPPSKSLPFLSLDFLLSKHTLRADPADVSLLALISTECMVYYIMFRLYSTWKTLFLLSVFKLTFDGTH